VLGLHILLLLLFASFEMPSLRRSRPKLPYKLHPIYSLRHKTLWALTIGFILTLLIGYELDPEFIPFLFLFPVSGLFVVYDLMTWAIEKAGLSAVAGCGQDSLLRPSQDDGRGTGTHSVSHSHVNGLEEGIDDYDRDDDPPAEPKWPRKVILILDALFAVVFQWLFWLAIETINRRSGYYDNKVTKSYSALAAFVMSLLHGRACWLEVMARLKEKWMRSLKRLPNLKKAPCRRCGFVDADVSARINGLRQDDDEVEDTASRVLGLRKDDFGIPGWAKTFNERRVRASRSRRQRDDIEAGPSNDDDESESLIIAPTPEGSNERSKLKGYGTVSESAKTLNCEGQEVVKKKGSKRIVGEEWIEKLDSGNGKGKEEAGRDGEAGA